MAEIVAAGKHVIEETQRYDSLTIEEGARIKAPKGKGVTLLVNSVPTEIAPGTYEGDVELYVADSHKRTVGIWGTPEITKYRVGLYYEDGKLIKEKSILDAIQGGSYDDKGVNDVTIIANDGGFNGIFINGETEKHDYTINNAKIIFTGMGENDFSACGAGIAAYGKANIIVNDSDILIKGVTRGAIFAGDYTTLTVNRTRIVGDSLPSHPKVDPNWTMSLYGTNRVTNAGHVATCYYNDCFITSNGWGTMSVDGGKYNHLYYTNCIMMQTSPSGYVGMAIADNFNDYAEYDVLPGGDPCVHSFDNCQVVTGGVALIMCTGASGGVFKGGTVVNSRRWGTHTFRNSGGHLIIDDATFYTGSSSMLVKGSTFHIDARNAEFYPGNGTILQLFDCDDPGMGGPDSFVVPIGKVDTYTEGRDLTVAVENEDVFVNFADCELNGNIYNSTTNLYPMLVDPHQFDDYPAMERPPMPEPPVPDEDDDEVIERAMPDLDDFAVRAGGHTADLMGAKNLEINFSNVALTGILSAATQKYRDGVKYIDRRNRDELNNITQTAAPVVNNGVIAKFDGNSVWTVTETSYLSKLTLEEGAQITAPRCKTVTLLVDGVETEIKAGTYVGHITLQVS